MRSSVHLLYLIAVVAFRSFAAEDEFIPMFNGSDLSGWTNVNCAPNTFTVRGDLIVSTGIPTGVLRTKRMYENFIAELEWRHLKKGGNAGFFIYSAPITAVGQPFTKGMEIQIIDSSHPEGIATRHGDVFAIHGATFAPDRPHPRGWMRCLPSEQRVKEQGEWNHYRVESRDGRVTLAVNGKIVSGGSNCVPRKGYICLESEGSECHFRNVRIQELPSSNPPASEVAEEDQGFVSLYTGIDLSGWKEGAGHRGHWQPRDWILASDGKNEAGDKTLWSERTFGDFELIIDWRLPRASTNDTTRAAGLRLRGSDEVVVSFPVSGESAKAAKPVGQWNRTRLSVKGDRLNAFLNDQAFAVGAPASLSLKATGPIGIEHEGVPMEFANIYVRALK